MAWGGVQLASDILTSFVVVSSPDLVCHLDVGIRVLCLILKGDSRIVESNRRDVHLCSNRNAPSSRRYEDNLPNLSLLAGGLCSSTEVGRGLHHA